LVTAPLESASWHLYRFAAEEIDAAKQHCRLAIAADPEFAQAYVALAYATVATASCSWSDPPGSPSCAMQAVTTQDGRAQL